jgi:hypothetical protein
MSDGARPLLSCIDVCALKKQESPHMFTTEHMRDGLVDDVMAL